MYYCVYVYIASSIYHEGLFQGGTLTPSLGYTNRLDHYFAEGILVIIGIKLTPIYSSQLKLYGIYLTVLPVYSVFQLLQLGTIYVQIVFATISVLSYCKFHWGQWEVTVAMLLGSAGITFFFIGDYEIEPFSHALCKSNVPGGCKLTLLYRACVLHEFTLLLLQGYRRRTDVRHRTSLVTPRVGSMATVCLRLLSGEVTGPQERSRRRSARRHDILGELQLQREARGSIEERIDCNLKTVRYTAKSNTK